MPANRRRGQPQGQCHRKQTARARPDRASPPVPRARAKRCGKSAPRLWQQRRQGKPHREQDRIGAAVMCGTSVPARSQGSSRPAARVGRVRRVASRVPEEWPSRLARGGQNPAYRLSGLFIFPLFFHLSTVALQCSTGFPQSCPQEQNANIFVIQNCHGLNRSTVGKYLRKKPIFPGWPPVKREMSLTLQAFPCYPMSAHDGPNIHKWV
jgi:hypothetical protein